jgi:hypothetical protein
MSVIKAENWDGVTPPAIPAGWNVDANFTTSTTHENSSPNGLAFSNVATVNNRYYGTWATADGVGGNCTVSTYFYYGGLIGTWGVTARGSAATLNDSSTNQYVAIIQAQPSYPSGNPGTVWQIGIIQSGVFTSFINLTSVVIQRLSANVWYILSLTCNGSALSSQIIRTTDGYYMGGGCVFSSTPYTLSTSDSTLSGSGYTGFYALQGNSGMGMFLDNWELESLTSFTLPDRRLSPVYRPPNTSYWT